jgi:hypothetical protein
MRMQSALFMGILLSASCTTEIQHGVGSGGGSGKSDGTSSGGSDAGAGWGGGSSGGGGSGGASDGGASGGGGSGCAGWAAPTESGCCKSCSGSNCQTNGCYGGWYCETSSCTCHAMPTGCSGGGGTGGGGTGGGGPPPPVSGSVGPGGGTVDHLYFAIVGDTRPANIDGTSSYPTQVIDKIYADIAAMSPQPSFVITTGDYMFASPSGGEGAKQIAMYWNAAKQFSGPIFAAMGNHECTGATDSNCASSPTNNMNAFMSTLIAPLGQSLPYYSIPVSDSAGKWSAKIVVAACNAWDSTQSAWLQSELAKSTTYTFVVRHEPTGTSGPPCVSEMDTMLSQSAYDLFIVGHSHTFAHSGHEITVGNGGAPITGSTNYGYATVEQQAAGGFLITQYDYMTAMPVATFTVQ